MINFNILDILIIISYPLLINLSYCFLICINNYHFSTRLTYLLLLPTISISCLGTLSISVIKYLNEIHYLIIFNIENFFAINFMVLFTYRGILRYYLKKENIIVKKNTKNKNIFIVYLFYIFIIHN